MNARYYVPSLGRFASADTIVPDPSNPQQFNRFSYVLNNPLHFTDPTGHCATGDTACWTLADSLYEQFGWYLDGLDSNGRWTLAELQIIWDAAIAVEIWFANNGGGDAHGRMRDILGNTAFVKAGVVGNLVLENMNHIRGSKVHLLPSFNIYTVVHELGHILDNKLGSSLFIGSALFGGGPADDMSYTLGGNPSSCGLSLGFGFRSVCAENYQTPKESLFPSAYAANGPSEDFAETFKSSVLNPNFNATHPLRNSFITDLGKTFTNSQNVFQGSPYTNLQRYGGGGGTYGGMNLLE